MNILMDTMKPLVIIKSERNITAFRETRRQDMPLERRFLLWKEQHGLEGLASLEFQGFLNALCTEEKQGYS